MLASVSALLLGAFCATALADSPPSIEGESVSNVTSTDATLEATINPESASRDAYYQFQLVAAPSEYLQEFACPTEGFPAKSSFCGAFASQAGALPIDVVGPGTQGTTVSLDLSALRAWWAGTTTLKPNTTYHYRVIAARRVPTEDTIQWEAPIVYGADETFTTPAAESPKIESVSVANLTSEDATLGAQLDTEGLETEYEFKMWASPCGPKCELIEDVRLPKGKLLGSFVSQTVSLDLASAGVKLVPGGEYGYSLTATSAGGTSESAPQTFTVPQATAVPLTGTTSIGGSSSPGSGSQTSGPSLTPPSVGYAVADLVPTRKAAVKGHVKVKRSVHHKKRKHRKSKAGEHKHHKASKG